MLIVVFLEIQARLLFVAVATGEKNIVKRKITRSCSN